MAKGKNNKNNKKKVVKKIKKDIRQVKKLSKPNIQNTLSKGVNKDELQETQAYKDLKTLKSLTNVSANSIINNINNNKANTRIEQIKALDGDKISKMSKEELQTYAKDATRFTKQRLSYLSGKNTHAKTILEKERGSLDLPKEKDIMKMDVNELRKLVVDERNFLKNKTSTLAGERQRIRNVVALGIDETQYNTKQGYEAAISRKIDKMGGYWGLSDLFDLIDKIKEVDKSLEFELSTNPSLVGAVIESYTEKEFIEFRDNPVEFAKRLRKKYVEEIRRKEEQDIPF